MDSASAQLSETVDDPQPPTGSDRRLLNQPIEDSTSGEDSPTTGQRRRKHKTKEPGTAKTKPKKCGSRFEWCHYKDAQEYMISQLKDFMVIPTTQEAQDFKERTQAYIIKKFGPFGEFTDAQVLNVSFLADCRTTFTDRVPHRHQPRLSATGFTTGLTQCAMA